MALSVFAAHRLRVHRNDHGVVRFRLVQDEDDHFAAGDHLAAGDIAAGGHVIEAHVDGADELHAGEVAASVERLQDAGMGLGGHQTPPSSTRCSLRAGPRPEALRKRVWMARTRALIAAVETSASLYCTTSPTSRPQLCGATTYP